MFQTQFCNLEDISMSLLFSPSVCSSLLLSFPIFLFTLYFLAFDFVLFCVFVSISFLFLPTGFYLFIFQSRQISYITFYLTFICAFLPSLCKSNGCISPKQGKKTTLCISLLFSTLHSVDKIPSSYPSFGSFSEMDAIQMSLKGEFVNLSKVSWQPQKRKI